MTTVTTASATLRTMGDATMNGVAPYIISADIKSSFAEWGAYAGYQVPDESFFASMTRRLGQILADYIPDVRIVEEQDLRDRSLKLIGSNSSLISLDRIYVRQGLPNLVGYLNITRTVNMDLQSLSDEGVRAGAQPIDKQLDVLAAKANGRSVVLFDDVVFEGKSMVRAIQRMRERGINIERAVAGIAIERGAKRVRSEGVQLDVVYPFKDVQDEVCERDFVIGAAWSGRTCVGPTGRFIGGVPYLLPFGRPADWASVPATQCVKFSQRCLGLSEELWQGFEDLNGCAIPTAVIPRKTLGLIDSNSIVEAIKEARSRVK